MKKRILFVMGHRGFVRNYGSSLRLLHDRGHELHLVYLNPRARKGETVFVEWLLRDCPNITVTEAPPVPTGTWATAARATRLVIDYVRYFDSRFDQAAVLRERAESQLSPWLRRCLAPIRYLGDRGVRSIISMLTWLHAAMPVGDSARELISTDPDLVLVTPLVDFGSALTEYVNAAQALGVPTGCCVASWDNLTNKGHMRTVPDRVFVWNEAQRDEAVTLHGIPRQNVVVTGAQLFDDWFERRPAGSREALCEVVGLDPQRPFVVFLGSSLWIAPGEVFFVERWIRQIRVAADPDVANVGILVRPHPSAARRYLTLEASDWENVAIWPPFTRELIEYFNEEGKGALFETLYHASAAVGVNTSAMIEAGIVGCPTYTVQDSGFVHAQRGTLHFRHLTNTAGGLVRPAADLEEHVSELTEVLGSGGKGAARAFLESFVRPHGIDTPAAPILADAIEAAADLSPAPRPAWGARVLRMLMYPGAFLFAHLRPLPRKRKKPPSMPALRLVVRLGTWVGVSAYAAACTPVEVALMARRRARRPLPRLRELPRSLAGRLRRR